MTNIRIFDDQYWWIIYKKLNPLLSEYGYPVKNNIKNPVPFINKIRNWDIILLDNYFPWKTWEEPIWDVFLQLYIKKWLNCKIICISDYWNVLLDRYENWNLVDKRWNIIWYIPSKDVEKIANIIKSWQGKMEK